MKEFTLGCIIVALFLLVLGIAVVSDTIVKMHEINKKYEFLSKHPYLYDAEDCEAIQRYYQAMVGKSETE
jgi:hypothetical protein